MVFVCAGVCVSRPFPMASRSSIGALLLEWLADSQCITTTERPANRRNKLFCQQLEIFILLYWKQLTHSIWY